MARQSIPKRELAILHTVMRSIKLARPFPAGLRSPSTLRVALRTGISLCGTLVLVGPLFGQDLSTPSASPAETAIVSPTPTATATPFPVRSVRINFVPPPLDGTISLGIYDQAGKLVRVLHQQAPIDAFTIGADALQTKWDGKDNDGQDLPAGKYHARGYAVGSIQTENPANEETVSTPSLTTDEVSVKLLPNPLVKNDRPTVGLTVGFDDTDSFLKTVDELPLLVISQRTGITSVALAKSGEKSIDVWQESGAGTERFRLSKLDQMMAFDCGAFDLK